MYKSMKISFFLMFLCVGNLFAVHVKGQDAVMHLPEGNISVAQFLSEIEKQTNYLVIYSNREIDTQRKVYLETSSGTVNKYLNDVFAGTNVHYVFENDYIILTQRSTSAEMTFQTIVVTGVVTDETGETLPGVNVSLKGTRQGTVTDVNGAYSINVPDANANLLFSFVGYDTQEILVGNQLTINITLEEIARGIAEVVIVGYGVQKRVNLTGAVGYVGSETLKDRPAANINTMLQGAVPGLNITRDGGIPGYAGNVNIRGITSINGGEPLVLIDGVPGEINQVNPNDVESISVLKDASSAAIYGARGAFGVILVTTKNAKSGKVSVNYRNNFGWQTPTTRTDYHTNGYESVMMNDEAMSRTTGNSYTRYSEEDYRELEIRRYDKTEHPNRPWVVVKPYNGQDIYHYYGNWDWYHFLYRDTRPTMRHDISFQGGDDKVDYMLSGSYYREEGILRINNDVFDSYNFRAKINGKITNWLTISNNTSYYSSKYKYWGEEQYDIRSNFHSIQLHGIPAYAPVNPDGSATFTTMKNAYQVGNGRHILLMSGVPRGERLDNVFQTTTQLMANITGALTVTGNFTYRMTTPFNWFRAARTYHSIRPGILEEVSFNQVDQIKETMVRAPFMGGNFFFNYDDSFGKHHVGATGGVNYENQQYKRLEGRKNDLMSLDLNDINLGTGVMEAYGNAYGYVIFGAFFRANYDYADRYLIEFNGRYDGTSRFGKGRRFGFFPSISAGWRISEEPFFESVKQTVSMFKLRGSYGSLGNQLGGNYYPYISSMGSAQSSWLMNQTEQLTNTVNMPAPVDGKLTWEKASTINFGIDLGFIKNKLSASFDVYERRTTGMLTAGEALPSVYGATPPSRNSADLSTKGFEINIQWNDRIKTAGKPLSYNIGISLSDSRATVTSYDRNPEKILELRQDGYDQPYMGSYLQPGALFTSPYKGMEVGEIWGFTMDGYFETDEEGRAYTVDQRIVNSHRMAAPGVWSQLHAGDIKFVDLNDNGRIDRGNGTADDAGDLRKIGNRTARYAYGINLGASWNGIDVSVFVQGIMKQEWYPGPDCGVFWGPYCRPYMTFIPKDFINDIWTPENPNAYFPLLRAYDSHATSQLNTPNKRYLQDLAYLRLKNLTVGYSLPRQWVDKLFMQNCRIYFSGENLFYFTKFRSEYIDPEAPTYDPSARTYPFFKTWSFGLDLTF